MQFNRNQLRAIYLLPPSTFISDPFATVHFFDPLTPGVDPFFVCTDVSFFPKDLNGGAAAAI
jgi:hypothetical protein